MPQSNFIQPVWADCAFAAVETLRRHHGVPAPQCVDTAHKMEPLSELDELFARFDDGKEGEVLAESSGLPSRYVPARQLLTTIRLAATISGSGTYAQSRPCGALTVISDIEPKDMRCVKDILALAFPHEDWQIVSPDIVDGSVTKNAQDRFEIAIADHIDRIEPVLILQANGVSLPRHLVATGPQILPFATISRDILMIYMLAGHLCDQITDPDALFATLPKDADLTHLGTLDICAALRAPMPMQAVQRLEAMMRKDAKSCGPRLEDLKGDSPAILAAWRIVDDLLLWKRGKAQWDEISRSLLLYGPPGTGKTYLAKAMAQSAGITAIHASFADWQAKGHLGDMLAGMKHSFAEARQLAPSVLIIDEIDAVGSRSDGDRHASNYRFQVINAFLGEMDSIAQNEGVVVIGTCNHPERMDPAVIRAGRMDHKIQVPLPDAEALLGILRHHLHEDIADDELQALSHLAVGRSAADIDAAIRAARSDARRARKLLNVKILHKQMGIETSGADGHVLWRIALHEAGHAVAGAALGLGATQSIVITQNGGQIQRRHTPTESLLSDIEAAITYSLAGRAAEKLVLGEVSAGAGGAEASDLALATRAALQLETTLGLGFEGLVWNAASDAKHLQTPAIHNRVRQRLVRAEQRAVTLLAQHRDILEGLARDLVEKRTMQESDIHHWLQEISDSATPTEEKSENAPASPDHPSRG